MLNSFAHACIGKSDVEIADVAEFHEAGPAYGRFPTHQEMPNSL